MQRHFNLKKPFARWAFWCVTVKQKRNHVRYSKDGLQLFQQNSQDCRHCKLNVNTLLAVWDHGTIQIMGNQPMHQKNVKTVSLAGKLMATVFRDCQEIIYFDYLGKGQNYWRCTLLVIIELLQNQVERKISTIGLQKFDFHHKALDHSFVVVVTISKELLFKRGCNIIDFRSPIWRVIFKAFTFKCLPCYEIATIENLPKVWELIQFIGCYNKMFTYMEKVIDFSI